MNDSKRGVKELFWPTKQMRFVEGILIASHWLVPSPSSHIDLENGGYAQIPNRLGI